MVVVVWIKVLAAAVVAEGAAIEGVGALVVFKVVVATAIDMGRDGDGGFDPRYRTHGHSCCYLC